MNADDLAERFIAGNLKYSMVQNADEIARAVRILSESNGDQANSRVQEYRAARSAIGFALKMMDNAAVPSK